MKRTNNLIYLTLVLIIASCNVKPAEKISIKGTFGYDLDFLKSKDSIIVLKSKDGEGQIIISPKYQAKVFTSTANGLNGKSFGWINYKTFSAKALDQHMNAFGGEDRLWLGPEGGKFSVFFKPGTKMAFPDWHTPPAFDFENWQVSFKSEVKASFVKTAVLQNYSGSVLNLTVLRDIEILDDLNTMKKLEIEFDGKVKSIAFKTTNTLINIGTKNWDKNTGAPCLWNLDMFTPSEKTTIVVPYNNEAIGKVATTDYFGQIPPERVKYNKGVLLFKADGKSRGKLGIPPNRAKNTAGSYDAQNNILTIALFDKDSKGTYLNQEWRTDRDPFSGDAVNAYNDGPLADGSQMGPFYEIESVSPAAFLKPNEGLKHTHSVFHFTGDKAELNKIALKTLGISLDYIQAAFK